MSHHGPETQVPCALHRTYEGEPGEKQTVFYIATPSEVKRLTGAKAAKWAETFTGILRVTQAHSTDVVLLDLAERGVDIQTAHWHATGIASNLAPEEIAKAFAAVDASVFRPFVSRPDLAELRTVVDSRLAIMEHRKADLLRLSALKRTIGLSDEDEVPEILKAVADEINADKRKFETPVDKHLAKIAQGIPECVLFNAAAGVADGWATAATMMAFLGDISRFPTVSALWHYCGYHVVDGHAPHREHGKPGTWNPRLRTALWQLGVSIIKNRENRWRLPYEKFVAEELLVHEQKHPGCKTIQGHCGARARRRIVKEILKEFYSSVQSSHLFSENHRLLAAAAD